MVTCLMLMLDLARAENMVAETPFLLAICCPTAARMQQWSMDSTWLMRPLLMAFLNLNSHRLFSMQAEVSDCTARLGLRGQHPFMTASTSGI